MSYSTETPFLKHADKQNAVFPLLRDDTCLQVCPSASASGATPTAHAGLQRKLVLTCTAETNSTQPTGTGSGKARATLTFLACLALAAVDPLCVSIPPCCSTQSAPQLPPNSAALREAGREARSRGREDQEHGVRLRWQPPLRGLLAGIPALSPLSGRRQPTRFHHGHAGTVPRAAPAASWGEGKGVAPPGTPAQTAAGCQPAQLRRGREQRRR